MAPNSMTYKEQRDLRHLKDVADEYTPVNPIRKSNWHSLTRRVDLSARDLARLVTRFSRATNKKSDKRIRSLSRHYRADFDTDLNQLRPREIRRLLEGYMDRFDKLFFFGLLTRKVKKGDSSRRGRQLAKLNVKDAAHRKMVGQWDPRENTINIWLRGGADGGMNGDRRTLDELLATLAHEMIHGFLDIFADELDDDHYSWVETSDGHGEVFHDLHHFMLKKMCSWIREPTAFLLRERNLAGRGLLTTRQQRMAGGRRRR